MLKLIIVDDDGIIRRGLSRNIPWENHGIALVGTAGDGETGLAMIEEKRPEIVISDIRMPFKDGLELAREAKEKYPDTKIILLTSYDEFEFAKEALRLKVFEYVMKPADYSHLLETVMRAAEEIRIQNEWKQRVLEGMPLLRQRFLEGLIHGRVKPEEMDASVRFLELPLFRQGWVALVVKADEYHVPEYETRFGKELLKYCLHNVSEELLAGSGVAFDSYEDELVLLYASDSPPQSRDEEACGLAERIRGSVEQHLRTTVTVGVGAACSCLTDIRHSYQEARSALELRHLYGTNQVITVQDTGIAKSLSARTDWSSLHQEIVDKVKLGLEQDAGRLLERLRKSLHKQAAPIQEVRLVALELGLQLCREGQKWRDAEGRRDTKDAMLSLFETLLQRRTLDEMLADIAAVANQVASGVKRSRESQRQGVVRKAKDYLEAHYTEEGLSLQEVASSVHVCASHLSVLFKQEAGVHFSEYLTELRMKKAMELLRTDDAKIYETAMRVGYGNPQYFSVLFKKHTGCSPMEFKQKS